MDAVIVALVSGLIAGLFALGQHGCTESKFERTGPAVGAVGYWKEPNDEIAAMKGKQPKLDYWEFEQTQRTSQQRWLTRRIEFGVEFEDIPTVHVALSGFDLGSSGSSGRGNDRLLVFVQDGSVTTTGCEIVIASWADTEVHFAQVRYFAYGTKK